MIFSANTISSKCVEKTIALSFKLVV